MAFAVVIEIDGSDFHREHHKVVGGSHQGACPVALCFWGGQLSWVSTQAQEMDWQLGMTDLSSSQIYITPHHGLDFVLLWCIHPNDCFPYYYIKTVFSSLKFLCTNWGEGSEVTE